METFFDMMYLQQETFLQLSGSEIQSLPVQSFMVIKSITNEFVQAQQVGLVLGEVNMIFGDVMGSQNTEITKQQWSN